MTTYRKPAHMIATRLRTVQTAPEVLFPPVPTASSSKGTIGNAVNNKHFLITFIEPSIFAEEVAVNPAAVASVKMSGTPGFVAITTFDGSRVYFTPGTIVGVLNTINMLQRARVQALRKR